jgi:hypothetical protein
MIKNIVYASIAGLVLVACSEIPKEAYYNRGEPESLLDVSSEVVNLPIDSPANIQELINQVNKDQPTSAELHCSTSDALCEETENVLHQFGVPVKHSLSASGGVELVYQRIMARDCESRYIDNTINPYNLNHPTFGCSLAANSVQMVSDKRQFTNPAMMGNSDASKAVQTLEFYNLPNAFAPEPLSTDFQDLATQQSLQTNGLTGGTR